jgi:nucleoside-diphosphate-sugar epimerase
VNVIYQELAERIRGEVPNLERVVKRNWHRQAKDDLCWAILLALESDLSGEVFQVATGVEMSIIELARMIQE